MANFADALAKDSAFTSSPSLSSLRLTKGRLVLLLCFAAGLTEVLLAVRFVVQFMGMGWSFVVLLTDPLVAPFREFEPSPTDKTTGVFEFATVLAAEVYLLAFMVLVTLLAGLPLLRLLAKGVYLMLCELGWLTVDAAVVTWRGSRIAGRWTWAASRVAAAWCAHRYVLAADWTYYQADLAARRCAVAAREAGIALGRHARLLAAAAARRYDGACLWLDDASVRIWRRTIRVVRAWASRVNEGRRSPSEAAPERLVKSAASAVIGFAQRAWRGYDAAALWMETAVRHAASAPSVVLRRVVGRWRTAGQGGGPRGGE